MSGSPCARPPFLGLPGTAGAAPRDRRRDRARARERLVPPRRRDRGVRGRVGRRTVAARECVGLGNGLDALRLRARSLRHGPGDEVIVPVEHLHRHMAGRHAVGATARSRRVGSRDVRPGRHAASAITSRTARDRAGRTSTASPRTSTRAARRVVDRHGLRVSRMRPRPTARALRGSPSVARGPRRLELLPRQEPRGTRRRRGGHHGRSAISPTACGACCATTARG